MINYPCPLCQKSLSVPERKAGIPIACPHCRELSVVPSEPVAAATQEMAGSTLTLRPSGYAGRLGRMPVQHAERPGSLLLGATGWPRWAAALVAGAALLSVLLAVAASLLSLPEDMTAAAHRNAVVLVPSCLVLLLILLNALATRCPSCEKCWARTGGKSECLSREVIERGNLRRVRAKRELIYRCRYCGHAWSMTFTDEF